MRHLQKAYSSQETQSMCLQISTTAFKINLKGWMAPSPQANYPAIKKFTKREIKKILNMKTKNHLCIPPRQYPAVVISTNTMQIKSAFFLSFHLDLKNIKVGKSWK